MKPYERIIIALDVPSVSKAKELVEAAKGLGVTWKVGMQLFTLSGPEIVSWIQGKGEKVCLDLKYHDILETVRKASAAARDLGVSLFTIHVQREATMRAVMEAIQSNGNRRPLVIGVTVLTDHKESDVGLDIEKLVVHRSRLARSCGLDGVVCSPKEVAAIRKACGWDFIAVVPGVRSPGKDVNDQKRLGTPERAISEGADYLVCGRQITESSNPVRELTKIAQEVKRGTETRVARRLRQIQAVDFNGQKGWRLTIHKTHPDAPRSPFYLDFRLVRSYPSLLGEVAWQLGELLKETGDLPDLLSDVPSAATPLVTLVSQATGIPMISPRPEVKTHGKENEIDGAWKKGQTVVIIDDLRTTGGSKERVIAIFKKNGLRVLRVLALVDRGESAKIINGVPFYARYRWSYLLNFYQKEKLRALDIPRSKV